MSTDIMMVNSVRWQGFERQGISLRVPVGSFEAVTPRGTHVLRTGDYVLVMVSDPETADVVFRAKEHWKDFPSDLLLTQLALLR
jgi:hypothetical protein